jgi:lipopolysaccharide export system protein LptA
MNRILKARLAGLILLCGIVSTTTGLPTDSRQELKLIYDSSSSDIKNGVTVYTGNVKLTQGSLRIESDELVVHGSDKAVEKMIATGSPAVFEQQPSLGQAPVIASGKRIEYELKARIERVAIIDQAVLEQGNITSKCARIDFNLTESTAKMTSCVTERPALQAGSSPASES